MTDVWRVYQSMHFWKHEWFIMQWSHKIKMKVGHQRKMKYQLSMFSNFCFSPCENAWFYSMPFNYVITISLILNTGNCLNCYQCIGTHPGCTLYNMDWIFQDTITCSRKDDRCVKVSTFYFISHVLWLSNLIPYYRLTITK